MGRESSSSAQESGGLRQASKEEGHLKDSKENVPGGAAGKGILEEAEESTEEKGEGRRTGTCHSKEDVGWLSPTLVP